MREICRFSIDRHADFKRKALHWAGKHPSAFYFDSNQQPNDQYRQYECLIGVASPNAPQISHAIPAAAGKTGFGLLESFWKQQKDWLFGFLCYDLKNEAESLHSRNTKGGLSLPELHFVCPDVVIAMPAANLVQIETASSHPVSGAQIFDEIKATDPSRTPASPPHRHSTRTPPPQARMGKAEYLRKVEAVRQHIATGDVYELNLCLEFFARNAQISPLRVFERLNRKAKAPFAAYAKAAGHHIMGASPERFLQKNGSTVVSQPIKGTIRRGHDLLEDEILKASLKNDPKERAENVMIVDLVRNDLTRGGGKPGTVTVPELFGVHTFETVHHLISTVRAQLPENASIAQLLESAFPPGSMTGAPKVMAMDLIERYELSRRGLYAGAIGYFAPNGNFDFNVVIRSLLYNEANGYLSFHTGGAITHHSQAEREYEECLLKANALMEAISGR